MNKKINYCRLLPDLLKTHYKYIPLIRHNKKWVSEGIIEIFLNILLSVNTNLNFDTYLHSFYSPAIESNGRRSTEHILTQALVILSFISVNEGPVLPCSETVLDAGV